MDQSTTVPETEQKTAPGWAGTSAPEPIMQFFAYAHLPPHLVEVSCHFKTLADHIVEVLPRSDERTVALRKLLESKDAAVRARIAK